MNMDEVAYILEVQILRDYLLHELYVKEVLDKFHINNYNPVDTQPRQAMHKRGYIFHARAVSWVIPCQRSV